MKRSYALVYLIPALILGCSSSQADTTITVSWDAPEQYCDGSIINPLDIQGYELYIDAQPIPASEDPACGAARDVPPSGITPITASGQQTTLDAVLTPGITYFMRVRIQANGVWSNFSSELTTTIAQPEPGILQNFRFN